MGDCCGCYPECREALLGAIMGGPVESLERPAGRIGAVVKGCSRVSFCPLEPWGCAGWGQRELERGLGLYARRLWVLPVCERGQQRSLNIFHKGNLTTPFPLWDILQGGRWPSRGRLWLDNPGFYSW
jgi:hypothetical protein